MNRFYLVLFSLTFILLVSCKNKEDASSESNSKERFYHLQKQGWRSKTSTQFVDGLHYKATEVPVAYFVLKEVGADNLERVDSICKTLERERIIEFEFSQMNEEDLLQSKYTSMTYEASVKYMSFQIQKDFSVVCKQDTISCLGVTFERNFKVAPFKRVLLYFDDIPKGETIQLIYRDHLYKKGIFKFSLKERPIKL